MSASDSIGARTIRLNKIILGKSETNLKNAKQLAATLNRETLLDAFTVLYNECDKDGLKKHDQNIFEFANKYRDVIAETRKLRVNINDFTIKSIIGKGHFGDVHLATENITNDIYAIKKMPKSSYSHAKEERNIMAMSNSEWIPTLQYAFQDQANLYLVMEYLPGGDLLSLMIRNEGAFEEDLAKFYLAEITLALNALHTMGFVHRDIKPENILLDRFGHLKLADFGTAAPLNKDGNVVSFSPVGTPDYIAPELLQPLSTQKSMKSVYNESCDYWSMGVIGYELVTEVTPFHNDNVNNTYSEIVAHCENRLNKKLVYPDELQLSTNFRDLIDHLVTKMSRRFSYKQIVNHPYFDGVDWENLRHQVPPIIPSLSSDDDTSNFEDVDKKLRRNTYNKQTLLVSNTNNFSGQNLPFVGYSYVHEDNKSTTTFMDEYQDKLGVDKRSATIKDMQKTVDGQLMEIKSLQQNLIVQQRKCAQMESVEKILGVTKEELNTLKSKLKEKTVEIATCKTQIKTLKNSLKIEEEMRCKNDESISDVLSCTYQKWERAKKQSEQNYEKQISEKKTEILTLTQKLKVCEKELITKTAECVHLQETVDNFKERLRTSKNQISHEKSDFSQKQKELTEYYENEIKILRNKLDKEVEERRKCQAEMREATRANEENQYSLKTVNESKSMLDRNNKAIRERLDREIEENKALRNEKRKIEQKMSEIQSQLDQTMSELQHTNSIISSRRQTLSPTDGNPSVYCSLESLSSAVEEQLKKDLVLAKEGENEQRKRADRLEEAVKRLEDAIERLSKQNVSAAEGLLERKNERLEDKLVSVTEQAIVDRQASRTAHLALWKLEKQVESLKLDKSLGEDKLKRVQNEKEDLERKIKEVRLLSRSREEKINELQTDIANLKADLKKEHSMWETAENERIKEKSENVQHIATIHSLEGKLEECISKLKLYQQQKDSLSIENRHLSVELRREEEDLRETSEKQKNCEQKLESVTKNYEMLKKACAIMETQLNELEAMYNAEIKQNKDNCVKIDELWESVRNGNGNVSQLQQELSEERTMKRAAENKVAELKSEVERITANLKELHHKVGDLEVRLVDKNTKLLQAEEIIEVQREEISHLQSINNSLEREIVILKEENAKILTDLFMSKETNNKLVLESNTLKEQFNELKKELEQLNGTLSELNKYYIQREIKSEATQSQYKKLIDYLQQRVDELSQKKKKSLTEMLFGSSNSTSKKENVPPAETAEMKKLHETLRRERARSNQLKEQMLKAKTDLRTEQMNATIQIEKEKELTAKLAKELKPDDQPKSSHYFELTLQSNTTDQCLATCVVCNVKFLAGNSFWQCKNCNTSVHRKCRGKVNMICSESEAVSSNSELDAKTDYCGNFNEKYCGELLLREQDTSPPLKIGCSVEIVDNILLLGCSSGLEAYNLNTERLVHVADLENVTNISVNPTFPKCMLIAADGKQLLQCDLRQLQTRSQATICINPTLDCIDLDLPFINPSTNDYWQFVKIYHNIRNQAENSEALAIVGTQSRIVILRYEVKKKSFRAIRSLDTATPVKSVLFTQHTSIVSSDKFFEIDLSTFEAEEFLDLSDKSLLHSLNAQPMEAFKINSQEFLMCFNGFGIFVDEYGCRSRPDDIKWLRKPSGFTYRDSILFISSRDNVQVMRIHKSHSNELEAKENAVSESYLQASINLNAPKLLGPAGKHGVFVLIKNENGFNEILIIDGTKVLRSVLSNSMETVLSSSSSNLSEGTVESISPSSNINSLY